MDTTIIILNYNTAEKTIRMVNSAINNNIDKESIVVVDNNSTDVEDKKLLETFCNKGIRLISLNNNLGYGGAFNEVVKRIHSRYLCFCNSDMLFINNPFPELEKFYKDSKNVGCLGIQQLFPDFTCQRSYGDFLSLKEILSKIFFLNKLVPKKVFKTKNVQYVDGAFMFISSKRFFEVGGFNVQFFFYFEDMDLCKRLVDIGYYNFIYPKYQIIHERGFSTNKRGTIVSDFSIENFTSGVITFINTHLSRRRIRKLYLILLRIQCSKQILFYTILRTKGSKFNRVKYKNILKVIDLK